MRQPVGRVLRNAQTSGNAQELRPRERTLHLDFEFGKVQEFFALFIDRAVVVEVAAGLA